MASMDEAILCRCIERNQPNLVGSLCMGRVIETSLFYGEKAGEDFFWLLTLLLTLPVPSRRARYLTDELQALRGGGGSGLGATNKPAVILCRWRWAAQRSRSTAPGLDGHEP